jgi:mRNA interferase RelE/StbE
MDRPVRQHIEGELLALSEQPRPKGVKLLKASTRLYRIKLGPGKNYRAVYTIEDGVLLVVVLEVGDRKEVYRRLS